ncbi:protein phosphatase 2C 70-like isoform X2 [Apium graveolens]|uniref:protein phosphatase 2C 70-like isoform X2 n=1 Tax=Apium graveolens TaxID=4045 RepID=UPI003D799EDD
MAMSRAGVELTESSNSIHIAPSSSFIFPLLMLLLILLIIFFACRPWRFFSRFLSSSRLSSRPIKAEDLERLLVSDDSDNITEFARTYNVDVASHQTEGLLNSSRNQGLVYKHRLPHTEIKSVHTRSDSLILDISEDTSVGQTLKLPSVANLSGDIQKVKEDSFQQSGFGLENKVNEFVPEYFAAQRSILMLEVVSGPSRGLRYSTQSKNKPGLPLTLGRVPPSALLLKDSEVSGKHAMIKWNSNNLKWELADMGSLNGTLLNSRSISHANSGSRHWGDPNELASGDTITLGSSSKIVVQIISQNEKIPFKVGVASDPMSLRRGGKKFPMEDVCYYQWPLQGIDQFGLFGVCDGHGGAAAAVSASKLLQDIVADILADSYRREKVLTKCDASDVLREAFTQTEACLNHCYEGCTATMLMVWTVDYENFYAQCANVGDSACFVKYEALSQSNTN